jgi:[amino group carrier protein]-L-2-aminoadipate 6-kinase
MGSSSSERERRSFSSVNSDLLEAVMRNGYLPVISPVAVSELNEPLNIDGDRAAASVAKGIHAERVVFVTNVGGLMLDGKMVEKISLALAKEKLPEIGFGMQKKVIAAIEAIEGGVGEALICSGLKVAPLRAAFSHSGCTVIS